MGFRSVRSIRSAVGRSDQRVAAARQAESARTTRLAGAAQQFRSPSLSGQQSGFLGGIGAQAGLQGLFGGAVEGSIGRSRTQFLAGNRLAGLEGLLENFFEHAPRGVSQAQQAFGRGGDLPAVLAQIQGLGPQFFFGGQGGRESIAGLDPGQVGGFLGRRSRDTLALPGGSHLSGSRRETQPGTPENEFARRLAESQGIVDTQAFINQNPQLGTTAQRAALQGINTPQSALARDFFGGLTTADSLAPGGGGLAANFQQTIFDRIGAQNQQNRFGVMENLLPQGLQGLGAAGILGTRSQDFTRDPGAVREAQDLFAPLLFGAQ